jgi:hypothetical protein
MGGIQITFAPRTVSGVADHDANSGLAVTCVYGITKERLQISESPETFMRRLRIAKNFAQLTRPNDFPIWINGSAVNLIRAPLPNEYVPGVNTVCFYRMILRKGLRSCPVMLRLQSTSMVEICNERHGSTKSVDLGAYCPTTKMPPRRLPVNPSC